MAVEYDLQHRLRLKQADELQNKGLYSAAIVEIDANGRELTGDMIPWQWTQSFVGTDISVADTLSYETRDLSGKALPEQRQKRRQKIRIQLQPQRDYPGGGGTTYRLFGTQRVLTEITLDIIPAAAPEDEGCSAWATASYEAEIDFVREQQPDSLGFYLQVSASMYDRYLWLIGQGLAGEALFSVGQVGGFYAQWSPSISTREIKILADSVHNVIGSEGIPLPRIGNVGIAELTFSASGFAWQPSTIPSSPQQSAATQSEGTPLDGDRRSGFRWPGRR